MSAPTITVDMIEAALVKMLRHRPMGRIECDDGTWRLVIRDECGTEAHTLNISQLARDLERELS